MKNDQTLFTSITEQEAMQVNGGVWVQRGLGNALGALGAGWWRTNFNRSISRGNIGGALNYTDRYLRGLTGSLRRFGIAVPRYPF